VQDCNRHSGATKFLPLDQRFNHNDGFHMTDELHDGIIKWLEYPKGYLPPSIGSLRRGQAARASDTMAAEAE
jgi:hypothetical protein